MAPTATYPAVKTQTETTPCSVPNEFGDLEEQRDWWVQHLLNEHNVPAEELKRIQGITGTCRQQMTQQTTRMAAHHAEQFVVA